MGELNYKLPPTGDYVVNLLVIQNLKDIFKKWLVLGSCLLVIKIIKKHKGFV